MQSTNPAPSQQNRTPDGLEKIQNDLNASAFELAQMRAQLTLEQETTNEFEKKNRIEVGDYYFISSETSLIMEQAAENIKKLQHALDEKIKNHLKLLELSKSAKADVSAQIVHPQPTEVAPAIPLPQTHLHATPASGWVPDSVDIVPPRRRKAPKSPDDFAEADLHSLSNSLDTNEKPLIAARMQAEYQDFIPDLLSLENLPELKYEDSFNQPLDPFMLFDLPHFPELVVSDKQHFQPAELPAMVPHAKFFLPVAPAVNSFQKPLKSKVRDSVPSKAKVSSAVADFSQLDYPTLLSAALKNHTLLPYENATLLSTAELKKSPTDTEEFLPLEFRTISPEIKIQLETPKYLLDLLGIAPLQYNELEKLQSSQNHPYYYKNFQVKTVPMSDGPISFGPTHALLNFFRLYSFYNEDGSEFQGAYGQFEKEKKKLFRCKLTMNGSDLVENAGEDRRSARMAASTQLIQHINNALEHLSLKDAVELTIKHKKTVTIAEQKEQPKLVPKELLITVEDCKKVLEAKPLIESRATTARVALCQIVQYLLTQQNPLAEKILQEVQFAAWPTSDVSYGYAHAYMVIAKLQQKKINQALSAYEKLNAIQFTESVLADEEQKEQQKEKMRKAWLELDKIRLANGQKETRSGTMQVSCDPEPPIPNNDILNTLKQSVHIVLLDACRKMSKARYFKGTVKIGETLLKYKPDLKIAVTQCLLSAACYSQQLEKVVLHAQALLNLPADTSMSALFEMAQFYYQSADSKNPQPFLENVIKTTARFLEYPIVREMHAEACRILAPTAPLDPALQGMNFAETALENYAYLTNAAVKGENLNDQIIFCGQHAITSYRSGKADPRLLYDLLFVFKNQLDCVSTIPAYLSDVICWQENPDLEKSLYYAKVAFIKTQPETEERIAVSYYYAEALRKLGRYTEALKILETNPQGSPWLKPGLWQACLGSVYIQLSLTEKDKQLDYLQRAETVLKSAEKSVSPSDTKLSAFIDAHLSCILRLQGRKLEALQLLKRALTKHKQDPFIQSELLELASMPDPKPTPIFAGNQTLFAKDHSPKTEEKTPPPSPNR